MHTALRPKGFVLHKRRIARPEELLIRPLLIDTPCSGRKHRRLREVLYAVSVQIDHIRKHTVRLLKPNKT